MASTTKMYAAYKAGYLGNNILDTYFSFIANMIAEEKLTVVEDTVIASKFKDRYTIDLPLPFVRQVLGVGVQNKSFIENHGKYSVDVDELAKYRFNNADFNASWDNLVTEFKVYCRTKDVDIDSLDISDFILNILDDTDEKILSGEKAEENDGMAPIEYSWYSFVRENGEQQTELYSFIAALSISNITRQALFHVGEYDADYSDLHIYLDSPIIFSLLGMDEQSRTQSYKKLVEDMIKARCSVHVLDHNFQEVDSIIARAAGWATSNQYDLRKANNAARFFHDLQMNEAEISEYCESIEEKLNELGVTVVQTSYDIYQNQFQEDESCLFEMVKKRYLEHGYELTQDKEDSIRIDVRSIIMVYRERKGQTATRLQNAKHIMLTSNNAIANVSKKYESNRSAQHGHIPACISADLFGAILWLNSPLQLLEYQKQKLLADCYAFLKPDKVLLDKYIQSLDDARNADAIDEKTFLFLRTHKVVLDSLMDITRGDYARFNSTTYLEVYEDIQSKSQKLYRDEAAAHDRTREELKALKETSTHEKQEKDEEIEELKARITSMEERETERLTQEKERRIKHWGTFFTVLFVGIPYIILLSVIELIKAQYSIVSWKTLLYIGPLVLLSVIIIPLAFTKGKQWCFKFSRWLVERRGSKKKKPLKK